MQPSTRIGLVVIIVCLVGIFVSFELHKPGPSPTALINQQLDTAVDAANNGFPSQLMSVVSDDYKDTNGNSREEVQLMVTKGMQDSHDLQFYITTPLIDVNGDTATSDFTLELTERRSGFKLATRSVHVVWKEFSVRKWLIFHDNKWLATSSDLAPDSLAGEYPVE